MFWLILVLALLWLGYLLVESRQASRARSQITHIVHVNGTRGKSTVCRLISRPHFGQCGIPILAYNNLK